MYLVRQSVAAVLLMSGGFFVAPAYADHITSITVQQTAASGATVSVAFAVDWNPASSNTSYIPYLDWNTGDGAGVSCFYAGFHFGHYGGDGSGSGTMSDGRAYTWTRTGPDPAVTTITWTYPAYGRYQVGGYVHSNGCSSAVEVAGSGPVETDPAPPYAPGSVVAAPGPRPGDVTLAWSAPPDDGNEPVATYRIYRQDPSQSSYVLVDEIDAANSTYTDTSRQLATTTDYYVVGVNLAGEGAPSDVVNAAGTGVSCDATQVPAPPVGLRADPPNKAPCVEPGTPGTIKAAAGSYVTFSAVPRDPEGTKCDVVVWLRWVGKDAAGKPEQKNTSITLPTVASGERSRLSTRLPSAADAPSGSTIIWTVVATDADGNKSTETLGGQITVK